MVKGVRAARVVAEIKRDEVVRGSEQVYKELDASVGKLVTGDVQTLEGVTKEVHEGTGRS